MFPCSGPGGAAAQVAMPPLESPLNAKPLDSYWRVAIKPLDSSLDYGLKDGYPLVN